MTNTLHISAVTNTQDIQTIERLARIILHEVYDAYIPADHTDYFLTTYQRADKIEQQIQAGAEYYLLLQSDTAIGYIGLETKSDVLFLNKLYLLKEYRGNALGAQCMYFIEQEANTKQSACIELIVNRQNLRAIAFYQRHGFYINEELAHSSGSGHILYGYKMIKDLPSK